MADSDWSAAAREIVAGWQVRRYSSIEGESFGSVISASRLSEAILSVPVGWQFGDKCLEETLSEPSWRRSLRRSAQAVIISSTDSVLVFQPEAERPN